MITIWRDYASVRFGGLVDDAKNYFLLSSVTPYDQDNPRRELNEFRKRKRLGRGMNFHPPYLAI